jgi:hypothetical protein
MVKTVRAMVLAAAALAFLAGCNLDSGIFPDRLMGYEAFADVSGSIDPERVWEFSFQIIRDSRPDSGYPEYLVLVNDDSSFEGDHLIVFNADLKVLGKYTMADLDAMDPAHPYEGRGAMVDANGAIVVGNRRFTVGSRRVTYLDTPPTLWNLGMAIPENPAPNFGNIRAQDNSPVRLKYDAYMADWTSPAFSTVNIGPGSWGKLSSAWLLEAHVLMVSHRDGYSPEIYLLPRDLFAAGTLCPDLECQYPPSNVPSPDQISWETLGYTEEGFAVYRWDLNQYFRFDEFGAITGTPYTPSENEKPNDQRHLYGRKSGWYVFDIKQMSVERRAWWWK